MRTKLILAIGLMALQPAAFSETKAEPDESCDGGTYQLVECLNAKTELWDKRLNAAYREALKDAQPWQRDFLRQAQRAWIRFRDAECEFVAAG